MRRTATTCSRQADSDIKVTPDARKPIPSLVNKAVAAIHIRNDISCLQRKLWNVLLFNAYNDLPDINVQFHEIRVRDLMEEVGFDSKNVAYLKQALEDMVTTKLTWNILDEKGKQEWGVSSALGSAVISGGICSYSYSAHLRQKLHNPEFYTPVPLDVLRRFSSGHALALYENCLRYNGTEQTPWFSLEVFRDLLGVMDNSSYDDFKELNRSVIKPSVQEVNSISDIQIELKLKREQRKVTSIKFLIINNNQTSLPIEPGETFNPELLGRLREVFCLSENSAKEILVTHSEDRIIAVMTYVEDRYRAGKIQEGKIAPYFLRTIKNFDCSKKSTISAIDHQKRDEKARAELIAKQETVAKDIAKKIATDRVAQVEKYYSELEEDARATLLSTFEDYIREHNKHVFQFYRKGGIKGRVVHKEFVKFLMHHSSLKPFEMWTH